MVTPATLLRCHLRHLSQGSPLQRRRHPVTLVFCAVIVSGVVHEYV
jgi:hypothetical protein